MDIINNYNFTCFSLELMTKPVKTRCGHSFCHPCLKNVLFKRTGNCPLCEKNISIRTISKDDYMNTYIDNFKRVVSAIQLDTHLDSEYTLNLLCINFLN